jgi:DNA-binding PadR family transcriptional regulator
VQARQREVSYDEPSAAPGGRITRRARSTSDGLPLTSYATLGLLSLGGEFTAVELEARAHDYLRFFYWAPALSHIRRELDRLEGMGFVEAREVLRGRVNRTLKYRLTDEGVAALKDWAEHAAIDRPMKKNPTILRLWLGRRGADPQEVLNVLEDHIGFVKGERAELAKATEAAELHFASLQASANVSTSKKASATLEEDQAALARAAWHNVIMRYCMRDYDAELRNLKRLGEELGALLSEYEATMVSEKSSQSAPRRNGRRSSQAH